MTDRARRLLPALAVGVFVAAAVLVAGFVLARAFDGGPATDGSFHLTEPGVYEESADAANADLTGAALPDIALTDASGAERHLSEFRGTPLVVNFWFSTCAPCKRELREFATVDAELGDAVQFVGVDPFDVVEAMQRFADERGVEYPLWRDVGFDLADELRIVAYPVTLFVDADGRIVRQTGELDAERLRAHVTELLTGDRS